MKRWFITGIFTLIFFSDCLPLSAESREEEMPLTLVDCFQRALQANLDLSIERLNPTIATTNILTAQGAFDLRLHLDSQYGESSSPRTAEQQAADGLASATSQSTSFSQSLIQKFSPGTELTLGTNTRDDQSTFNNFRDQWNTFAGASFTQPLWRSFGTDNNLAQIRIAKKGVLAADAFLQYRVEQILTSVAQAYYELIFTRNDAQAHEESLQLAEQLLADNKARVEIGVMSPLDISQANAEAASRRVEVLRAQRAVRDQENIVRRLISSNVTALLNQRLIPTEVPPENWHPEEVKGDMTLGLQGRADYRQAKELVAQGKLNEAYLQNQTLPSLNLNGSYGFNGQDNLYDRSYRNVADTRDPQWLIGLTLELPFWNRELRGRRDQSRYQRIQQELVLQRLEQDIIVQIDNAAGQTETNRQRIFLARIARILAEESLHAEEEKLKAGITTSYVVLQLQTNLKNARVVELRAIADFQQSEAELARVQGQSLSRFHVEIGATPYSFSPYAKPENQIPK